MICRVTRLKVLYHWICHTDAEVVESVLHAEQVFIGPACKITEAVDRYGRPLELGRNLSDIDVMVIHSQESHNQVNIKVRERGIDVWMPKGTRLFEVIRMSGDEVAVDVKGCEVPKDLPIFQHMVLSVVDRIDGGDVTDESVPPTVPFSIEEQARREAMKSTQHDTSVSHIVQKTTQIIRDRLQRLGETTPNVVYPLATSFRFEVLARYGRAVADDEMSLMLRAIGRISKNNIKGILMWHHQSQSWQSGPSWDHQQYVDFSKMTAGVLVVDHHWIPFVVDHTAKTFVYSDSKELSPQQSDLLCASLHYGENLQPNFEPHDVEYGNCGRYALEWICAKMLISGPSMNDVELKETMTQFERTMDSNLLQRYVAAVGSDYGTDRMRAVFIQNTMTQPTEATFHAYGKSDAVNGANQLRNTGKIAAVLIAKGHPSQEAVDIGSKLAELKDGSVKEIVSAREAAAYKLIIEACMKNHIKMQHLTPDRAITTLQKFFRAKWAKRASASSQSAVVTDLSKLQWPQKFFMIQNGEWLQVQVPVQDEDQNRAILKVWLVQFGERLITVTKGRNGSIEEETMHTLSFKVYRSHVGEECWTTLQRAPVRSVFQAVFPGEKPPQFARVWGRRWMNGNKQVEPHTAESFDLLATTDKDTAMDILIKSGMLQPPVFISIRFRDEATESETPQGFRVIWMGKCITDALTATGSILDHKGLVYKVPSSYGIRVTLSRFSSAWSELKTDQLPSQVQARYKFTLAHLPPSINTTKIETWGNDTKWPIRVLKPFPNGTFLIGAESGPPEDVMSMNGQPILITPYQEGRKQMRNVLAGRLTTAPTTPNSSGSADTLINNDPWAGTTLGGKQHQYDATQAWKNWKPTVQPAPSVKSLDASSSQTSGLLKAQSERITNVEADLAAIKQQMQTTATATEGRFTKLESDLRDVNDGLKSSLDSALREQSAALISTFERLLSASPRTSKDESRVRSRSRA
eukprot:Skav218515  [mRNA]  locus=scaffold2478:2874:5958:- [translate_table: standard]